ncbi:MAG: helix-turn-helix domain-containing protein [Opitutaceae bacterium]|jgi:IclR family acetate operon transcriptional repressor|nr:helix-turn-helix domain-containing protein [Opitutaceae bacterium]
MSAHTVPILKRAIAVLRAVAEGKGDATTTKALAQTLGLPHSSTYRILQTFLAEDWVRASAAGQHEISFGLLPLLQPLSRHELLIETVREPLRQLARETGLTAKISVCQGNHAITLFRVESPRATSVSVKVGAAFHLVLGSSGTVLMSTLSAAEREAIIADAPAACWQNQKPSDIGARLRELARYGRCSDLGHYRADHAALSAPLRNRAGCIVAAMTVIGFPQDLEPAPRKVASRHLLACAEQCNRLLIGENQELRIKS